MLFEFQGSDWSYEMLAKDMLELHDPACITAVHQYKLEQDVKLIEPKQPSLHSVYEECIQVYTEWIKGLHAMYDDQEMLVTAVRTDKATAAAGQTISENALPAYTVSHVLQASGLQYAEASATFWLHAVAGAEGISVTDLTQLLQGASSSNILSDKLDPTGQQASDVANFLHHPKAAVPAACWRLLAIMLKRDVYVLDIPNVRLCCYPAHDGVVDVNGTADCSSARHPWCMKNWCQAGFHFILGKLPLPSAIKAPDCKVYVASQGNMIQSTARLNVAQPHASSQAVTALSGMGIHFATLRFLPVGAPLLICLIAATYLMLYQQAACCNW